MRREYGLINTPRVLTRGRPVGCDCLPRRSMLRGVWLCGGGRVPRRRWCFAGRYPRLRARRAQVCGSSVSQGLCHPGGRINGSSLPCRRSVQRPMRRGQSFFLKGPLTYGRNYVLSSASMGGPVLTHSGPTTQRARDDGKSSARRRFVCCASTTWKPVCRKTFDFHVCYGGVLGHDCGRVRCLFWAPGDHNACWHSYDGFC